MLLRKLWRNLKIWQLCYKWSIRWLFFKLKKIHIFFSKTKNIIFNRPRVEYFGQRTKSLSRELCPQDEADTTYINIYQPNKWITYTKLLKCLFVYWRWLKTVVVYYCRHWRFSYCQQPIFNIKIIFVFATSKSNWVLFCIG